MSTRTLPDKPSRDIVEAELTKLCQSVTFRNSLRLTQILQYLIENHLAGDDESLKESLIALHVFKKGDFDSRLDSSVRRALGRLRQALAKYYADEGGKDEVLIELPEGHYVPRISFHHREARAQATPASGSRVSAPTLPEENFVTQDQPTEPANIGRTPDRDSTNRKWTIFAVAVLVASFVAAVFLMYYRSSASPPARKSIAILDFRNLSHQPKTQWLAAALSELLRSEVAAGGKLRAVSDTKVDQMTADLSLGNELAVTPDLLIKIRRNLAIDLVLSGSYLCTGPESDPRIRLNIEILDTQTGDAVASLIENDDLSHLIDLITHTGAAVRDKLGEHELTLAEATRLKSLRPDHVSAVRLYAEGMLRMRAFDAKGAQRFFKDAIDIDPNYARAHMGLADAWAILGYQAKARDQAKETFEKSGGLPREDALWIEGRYRQLSHEWDRAIQVYQSLSTFYPDNADYGIALADCQVAALKPAAAMNTIASLRKALGALGDDPIIDLAEANAVEALGDFKREFAVAQRAQNTAHIRGARLLVASAELKQAWARYNLGEFQEAALVAVEARGAYVRAGDRGGEGAAIKTLADIKSDSGDLNGALKNYEEALSIFRQIAHQGRVAMTLNNMAYVFKDKGDLESANQLFTEAADLGRQIDDKKVEAMALNGTAIIQWRKGEIEQAKQKYEEAFAAFRDAGDRSHAATVLNNVGTALEDLGHLAEAKEYFSRSLQECRAIGDKPGMACELGNLGEVLIKQGNLTESQKDLNEQLTLGRNLPDPKEVSYGLLNLGQISIEEDDLKDARLEIEESLSIRDKLGQAGLAAESRLALAEVSREAGDYATAEKEASDAASQFHREKEPDEEAAAWSVLSRTYFDAKRFDDATHAAEIAMQLGKDCQDIEVRLSIRASAALARAGLGHAFEGRKQLEEIAADASRLGYIEIALNARLMLAQVAQGQANSAAMLQQLETDAANGGFELIVRKARALKSELASAGHHP